MKTFRELIPEDMIPGYDPRYFNYTLDNPRQVAKLLIYLEKCNDTEAIILLLSERPNLDGYQARPNHTLYRTMQAPSSTIFEYVNSLGEAELLNFKSKLLSFILCYRFGGLATLDFLLTPPYRTEILSSLATFFGWIAAKGNYDVVDWLLKKPAICAIITADQNNALRSAVHHNHVKIVKRLLEVEAVQNYATAGNNQALNNALFLNHSEMIDLLLELPQVRRASLELLSSDGITMHSKLEKDVIKSGFIRALWFDLKNAGVLASIQNLAQLETQVRCHLTHAEWLGQGNPLIVDELTRGLVNQVSALRLYGYLNYIKLENDAPNKELVERGLKQDWVDNLNQFIPLPKSLQHFEMHKSLRLVADKCLRTRLNTESESAEPTNKLQ